MRWLLVPLVALVLLVVLLLVAGAMLPARHVAARRVSLPAPPDRVWAALVGVASYPRWRTDVKTVELLPAAHGHPAWREDGANGRIAFAIDEAVPPAPGAPGRLVTRITDDSLPFGGAWTFDVAPDGAGTRLTITERGEVRNLLFRSLARFVFGHTRTIDAYLTALGRAFGTPVQPVDAEAVHGA